MGTREYFILTLNFCEFIACVAGFCYWHKVKGSYWKWFSVYLAIIFLVEMLGKISRFLLEDMRWNARLYMYFGIPIQFLFFFWLFSRQSGPKEGKRLPFLAMGIYLLSLIIESAMIAGINAWFTSLSYTIGNILLVVLIINYLLKFVNSDEILYYRSNMMFWITVGLAVFYVGTLPFFALRNTLYYEYLNVFVWYDYIQLILGCLMYLIFALAFVWGKPKS